MATEIYGRSDDLIEFQGDIVGEVGCYHGASNYENGVLVICSDGTLLEVKYGKGGRGIWQVTKLHEGTLFAGVEACEDEDADRYSDTARFRDGLKWAYAATKWGAVK